MQQLFLIVSLFLASLSLASQAQSICFKYNGGFFYTSSLNSTCNILCADHGGFDANVSRHIGNAVGMHFWPTKSNNGTWTSVECSSSDNNSNWGANGAEPDPNFFHTACRVNCACYDPTADCEGNSCDNLNDGDACKNNNGTAVITSGCVNNVCPYDGLECDDGNECTINDIWTSKVCAGTPVADNTPCGVHTQCNACKTGHCTVTPAVSCNDGNSTTCNDMCSASGVCAGDLCPQPVAQVLNNSAVDIGSVLSFLVATFVVLLIA